MFSAAVLAILAFLVALNLLLLVRLRSRPDRDAGLESRLRDDLARTSQRQSDESRALREEVAASIQRFASQTEQRTESLRAAVTHQLSGSREETNQLLTRFLTATTEMQRDQQKQLEAIRGVVDQRLLSLQTDNAAKLEQMRQTVDEKLQSTLETRLGESFRLVSERLEQVHKGLGEMQTLAAGVGDLKRVLGNVTTRGAWGEVQLENLLAQILAPEQYERDVATTGTNERVEFAIKLPGKDADPVWLPVDAKFPMETYQRLAAAAERGDADGVEGSARELETVIRTCAKTFSGKYLAPPRTTDFGILFLATEGLYAEALRRPGLAESLQSDFRVVLAGPTTFAALLNSLQMGFRTLAIQQRSSEVWKLLGDVKSQFGKYSTVLATIRKHLDQATQTVDKAATRTRVIQKRLKDVESSEEENQSTLHLIAVNDGD
ncbi:MAG TPA: DNA recombination protein RmuC [Bryobacteraceae bacterium]|jgi:DNA recombination protein RmuC|nr:DNA recombination protein RmuC [Bryobacteraceae bacterium]